MKNEITSYLLDSQLEDQTKLSIQTEFGDFNKQVEEWKQSAMSIVVTDESQVDDMKKAKQIRLEIKKTRTSIEAKRKILKEESLRTGQAIDWVANMLKSQIEPIEKHLELQEKFVQLKEERRKANLKQERMQELQKYNATDTLEKVEEMNDNEWKSFLEDKIEIYNLKLEAEKKRQQEEEEKAKENERLRAENEAIKKQNEELKRQAELQTPIAPVIEQAKPAGPLDDKKNLMKLSQQIKMINIPDMATIEGSQAIVKIEVLIGKLTTFIEDQANLI